MGILNGDSSKSSKGSSGIGGYSREDIDAAASNVRKIGKVIPGDGFVNLVTLSNRGKQSRTQTVFVDDDGNLKHNNLYFANEYRSPADDFIDELKKRKK